MHSCTQPLGRDSKQFLFRVLSFISYFCHFGCVVEICSIRPAPFVFKVAFAIGKVRASSARQGCEKLDHLLKIHPWLCLVNDTHEWILYKVGRVFCWCIKHKALTMSSNLSVNLHLTLNSSVLSLNYKPSIIIITIKINKMRIKIGST